MNPNKPPLALVPLWFVEEMALVLAHGLKDGRKLNDWQDRPWTEETALEYRSALMRHLKDSEETNDPFVLAVALASVSVNAMILLYHEKNRLLSLSDNQWTDPDMEDPSVSWVKNGRLPEPEILNRIKKMREDPENCIGKRLANTPIDPIGDQEKIAPGLMPELAQIQESVDSIERAVTDSTPEADHVLETPLTEPDQMWHRLHGWISLVDGDGVIHYYDGPSTTACRKGPRIPKGSLRNLYTDPIDDVCELCAAEIIKRKEQGDE